MDGTFLGKVAIANGKILHVACVGSGSPTVVLIHGLGGSSADWSHVQARLADVTHSCAVDRIGAGGSSPATADRTTNDNVDDLHAFLGSAGIETPVVLVGHSVAGLDLRLHAGRHPGDVGGMVFVDPTTVGQREALLAALPRPSPTEPDSLSRLRLDLERGARASDTDERYDIEASEPAVAGVTSFDDIPVIVLSAEPTYLSLPPEAQKDVSEAWFAMHKRLADLSSDGRQETVAGAGHSIQLDRPEVIVDAIAEIVQKVREP